jgi:PEGA domain
MWVNKFQNLTKFQKLLVFILPILLIFIILLALFFTSTYTAKVKILIAPKTAELYIDGKKYKNSDITTLIPGEKQVIIKASGFKEYNKKINFSKEKTTLIYEWLEPTDDNKDYYNKNEDELQLRETIEQSGFSIELDEYNNDPIFKVTPVINYKLGFSASASRDENNFNEITLTIDLITCYDERIEKLKKNAESYFKQKGINLSKYKINYTHCKNNPTDLKIQSFKTTDK